MLNLFGNDVGDYDVLEEIRICLIIFNNYFMSDFCVDICIVDVFLEVEVMFVKGECFDIILIDLLDFNYFDFNKMYSDYFYNYVC